MGMMGIITLTLALSLRERGLPCPAPIPAFAGMTGWVEGCSRGVEEAGEDFVAQHTAPAGELQRAVRFLEQSERG